LTQAGPSLGGSAADQRGDQPRDETPVVEVENLRTYFYADDGIVRAVDGVSFQVSRGETLGIVGESGSGKSVTAASIMRLIPERGRIVSGSIRFQGREVTRMRPDELRQLRGDGIAMVFQDPMTSLNPLLRISTQLEEAMRVHRRVPKARIPARALELLSRIGISAPERSMRSYPYEFSGGMRQRVMLAIGVSNDPSVLIADEPTTALDVTIQAQFLDLLRQLNEELGVAVILISHDLGVVANLCRRVIVMYGGQIVEEGPTEELLSDPRHPYTWAIINAVPRLDRGGERRLTAIEGKPPDLLNPPSGCRFAARCPFRIEKCSEPPPLIEVAPGRKAACWVTQSGTILPPPSRAGIVDAAPGSLAGGVPTAASTTEAVATEAVAGDGPTEVARPSPRVEGRPSAALESAPTNGAILELRELTKHFPVRQGLALAGPSEVVHAVDDVSLSVAAGETLGLVGESGCGKSTVARLMVRLLEPTSGQVLFEGRDISHASDRELRPLRRRLQMVFQDPYSSLNGRMKVGDIIGEPIAVHGIVRGRRAVRERVFELLSLVGLPERSFDQFPHQFSGGQRQRIGLARALALGPRLVVADEPISSLDVNIQAQIINLLEDLQDELGLTYVFIAHDLSVVRHVSDRIAVLYLGKLVELASKATLYRRPLHPYTISLISAAPIPDVSAERRRRRVLPRGEPPSPVHPPSGCRFRTRCPIAQQICADVEPPLVEHAPGQFAACHFAEDAALRLNDARYGEPVS
jgi:peptide/nickel transport system ATP-binding protein